MTVKAYHKAKTMEVKTWLGGYRGQGERRWGALRASIGQLAKDECPADASCSATLAILPTACGAVLPARSFGMGRMAGVGRHAEIVLLCACCDHKASRNGSCQSIPGCERHVFQHTE